MLRRILGRLFSSPFRKTHEVEEDYGEEDEEQIIAEKPRIRGSNDKMVVGYISFKGGAGKSIATVSTALLESAMNGNVCLVDADVLNSTSTNILLNLAGNMVKNYRGYLKSIQRTFIDYFLEPDELHFVRFDFRRKVDVSIPLPSDTTVGISVKKIRLIPGSWPGVRNRFDELITESSRTLRNNLHMFFNNLANSFNEGEDAKNMRLCLIDFPVFSEVQRQSLWIKLLLKSLPSNINLVVFTEADTSSIRNLVQVITLLDTTSGIRGRILGVVINKVNITSKKTLAMLRKQASYLYKHLRAPVYVFPFDKVWTIKITPPVIINPPDKGANLALTFMASRENILRRSDLKRVFKYDPETKMPSELKPENLIASNEEKEEK